ITRQKKLEILLNIGHFCPGGKSVCPDTSTCCLVAAKEYGCCPMQDAVCCEDHTHCCPNGTKLLHFSLNFAFQLHLFNYWIKMQSKLKVAKLNKCWQCSLNSTCCKIGFKNIAYCPLAQAVSCAGHKHCCPQHTICDQALKSCITEVCALDTIYTKE
ncbi:unnamed protein product, partial [Thelazia callipaeda]|uniref:GRANULINS domain-containing protein n=1 Tax=Thelazia callipaeda TaxID=103827 RepID=A0A0N5CVM7_THECL